MYYTGRIISSFLFVLISQTSDASTCGFKRFHQKQSSLNELAVALDQSEGLSERSPEWFRNPRKVPEMEQIVSILLRLSPEDRQQAREVVDSNLFRLGYAAQAVFHLALYTREAWEAYFQRIFQRGDIGREMNSGLVPVLRNMPEELVEHLLGVIRENDYLEYSKYGNAAGRHMGPKRAIHAFLRHTLRGDEVILASIRYGKSALEAYEAYLRMIRETIAHKRIGQYGSKEVLVVAKIIQKHMKLEAEKLSIEDPEIAVGGSFPNGSARLSTSDLDTYVSHLELEGIYGKVNFEIAQALSPQRLKNVGLFMHSVPETFQKEDTAEINPVLIRILKDRIDLLVYGSIRFTYDEIAEPFVIRLD